MSTTDRHVARTDEPDAIHIDARDARGGEIILRSKRRRALFLGGLIGAGILGVLALA